MVAKNAIKAMIRLKNASKLKIEKKKTDWKGNFLDSIWQLDEIRLHLLCKNPQKYWTLNKLAKLRRRIKPGIIVSGETSFDPIKSFSITSNILTSDRVILFHINIL